MFSSIFPICVCNLYFLALRCVISSFQSATLSSFRGLLLVSLMLLLDGD